MFKGNPKSMQDPTEGRRGIKPQLAAQLPINGLAGKPKGTADLMHLPWIMAAFLQPKNRQSMVMHEHIKALPLEAGGTGQGIVCGHLAT